MKFATLKAGLFLVCLSSQSLRAQVCDPSITPSGLTSTYTSGSGALLQWDAVQGSVGVQIKATAPSGSNVTRRIIGFEKDQFLVPDALLTPGTYIWQVQAACSTIPPYNVTPISASNIFIVGSGSTCPTTITDIDGNVYATVQIGSQCWMAENMKVEHYGTGNPITTGLSNSAWQSTTSGAFAFPNNNSSNVAEYGLLYNWFAVDDAQNFCPAGWRVPSDDDWHELANFLDPFADPTASGSAESGIAGGKLKETGTAYWNSSSPGATNESGFSIRGAGYRNSSGSHIGFRTNADFWSRSECTSGCTASSGCANSRGFNGTSDAMFRNCGFAPKKSGFSVRCLKDAATSSCPPEVEDVDGNMYSTVEIGSQCWTAENLTVEHYRNGDAIPTGLSDDDWEATSSGAFAVYDNVAVNKDIYGLLYNWFAVSDMRELCPSGWHIPSNAEWFELTDFLGGVSVAGGKMKTTGTVEAGTGLWYAPNAGATNSSGFSGLPGGFRFDFGLFVSQGFTGYWWSSTEIPLGAAWSRGLSFDGGVSYDNREKQHGFSVRCLRD